MEKIKTILPVLTGLFFLLTLFVFASGNYSIASYPVMFLFACGLSLLLLNQFFVARSNLAPIGIYQPVANKLVKFLLLSCNAILIFLLTWMVVRASAVPFVAATIMFTTVIFIWLFCCRLIDKVSIAHIIMLAIALRLIWSFAVYPLPCDDFYHYWMTAQRMFYGIVPFQTKSPLTIIFYGIVSYFSHKQLWAVYIVNSIVAGLQVWLIYKITAFITSSRLSPKIAAFLYAIYPTAVTFSSVVSAEVVMVTMLLAAAYALCRKFDLDSSPEINQYKWHNLLFLIIISLFIAIAYLSRNTAILFLYTTVLGILLFSSKRLTQRIVEILLIVVFFFIFISPQMISNYHYYGKPSMVSVHIGGLVLLHGVSRRTDGRYDPVARDKVLAELGYTNKQLNRRNVMEALSKRASEDAMNNILSDKTGFIKFAMTSKFNRMWVADNFSKAVMYQSRAFTADNYQSAMKQVDSISLQYYLGLWVMALCAMILACFKKNIMITIFACYIILTFLLHFFYEIAPRYHFPVMPFACIIASYLWSENFIITNSMIKQKWGSVIYFLKNPLGHRSSETKVMF